MGSSVFDKLNLLEFYGRLKPRERTFLLGALTVILLFVSDVAVIRPLWDYYTSMEERQTAQEKKLVRNLLNINRKDGVERDFEKYRDLIYTPSNDEEEIGKLLSEIEQKARANNVVLVDMKPRDPRSFDYHKEYRTELDVEMTIVDWVRFVNQVQSSDKLIRLTAAMLKLKGDDPAVVKARMTFTKTLPLEKAQ